MNKRFIQFTLVAFLLVGIAACSGEKDSPLKQQFVVGCVSSGSDRENCRCAFDEMATQHTKAELFDMFTNMQHIEKLTKAAYRAQKACLL